LALELISQDSVVPAQNLAQFATATASSYSTIGPHFGPSSAIDGVADTRWNSAAWTKSNGDEQQWFQLSWKNSRRIARIQIAWGESPAVEYSVKSSSDGKTWKTLLSFSKGMGGIETHAVAPTSLRFLRIEGIKGTKGISAYSIREIRVFEK
jgi:hyaluronoglucosaminidase